MHRASIYMYAICTLASPDQNYYVSSQLVELLCNNTHGLYAKPYNMDALILHECTVTPLCACEIVSPHPEEVGHASYSPSYDANKTILPTQHVENVWCFSSFPSKQDQAKIGDD